MKISSFTVAIVLLLLTSSYLQATSADSGYDCNSKCGNRCSVAGKQGRCMKYCMMCCQQCKCVPSGNYGNKDECPCYRDWISPVTKRPKCP